MFQLYSVLFAVIHTQCPNKTQGSLQPVRNTLQHCSYITLLHFTLQPLGPFQTTHKAPYFQFLSVLRSISEPCRQPTHYLPSVLTKHEVKTQLSTVHVIRTSQYVLQILSVSLASLSAFREHYCRLPSN
jgi:hypothetical protein